MDYPKAVPCITPADIRDDRNIGVGVQIRAKFNLLKTLGVYGRLTNTVIATLMYETSEFAEICRNSETGELERIVSQDNEYARNRRASSPRSVTEGDKMMR